MAAQRWLPLESNPDVLNKYMHSLGASADWKFTDVYSLDPEVLKAVPGSIAAVLVLFPRTEKAEATQLGTEEAGSPLYFIKQNIGNACGTIGLIHSFLNNTDSIHLDGSKVLGKFYAETKDLTPEDRASNLEKNTGFSDAHEASAQEGQTQAPGRDEKVNLHFVAFVHHNGGLYELDGRRGAPVKHGDTTADTLLADTAKVVRQFMDRDPDEVNFTIMALAKA